MISFLLIANVSYKLIHYVLIHYNIYIRVYINVMVLHCVTSLLHHPPLKIGIIRIYKNSVNFRNYLIGMSTSTQGDSTAILPVQGNDASTKSPSKMSADEYRARHQDKIDAAKLEASSKSDQPPVEEAISSSPLDFEAAISYSDFSDSDRDWRYTRNLPSPAYSVVEAGEVKQAPSQGKGKAKLRGGPPTRKRFKVGSPLTTVAEPLENLERIPLSHDLTGVVMDYDVYRQYRDQRHPNFDPKWIPMHLYDGKSSRMLSTYEYVDAGKQWLRYKGLLKCSAFQARSSWLNFAKLSFNGARRSALLKAEAAYSKSLKDLANMPGPSPARPLGDPSQAPKYHLAGSNLSTGQEAARGYHGADAQQSWQQQSVRAHLHRLRAEVYAPRRKRAALAPSSTESTARVDSLEQAVRSLHQDFLAYGARTSHLVDDFYSTKVGLQNETAKVLALTQQVEQLQEELHQVRQELAHERSRRRRLATDYYGASHSSAPPAHPEPKKDQDPGTA